MELVDHGPPIKPYMDIVLDRNRAEYPDFIQDIHRRGLVNLTLEPAERVAMLFVGKKDKQLRAIVDARLPNRRFADAPGVSLATPEAFARLEVTEDIRPWMATVDVENCFYRMRIDHGLGRYFCLPPIRASELGVCLARG